MTDANIDIADNVTVIARIRKNGKEELVTSITKWQGHDLIDLRTHANYLADEGEGMRPTRKGVCFRVALLPEILAALHDCEAEARRRGLLPGASEAA